MHLKVGKLGYNRLVGNSRNTLELVMVMLNEA